MSQCTDVDAAIRRLERKIDAQNRCCEANKKAIADLNNRLRNLERGNKPTNQQTKPQDLAEIYKRLSKIESYINALDGTGNALKEGLKQIRELFLGN